MTTTFATLNEVITVMSEINPEQQVYYQRHLVPASEKLIGILKEDGDDVIGFQSLSEDSLTICSVACGEIHRHQISRGAILLLPDTQDGMDRNEFPS